jgi:hypothetical protein
MTDQSEAKTKTIGFLPIEKGFNGLHPVPKTPS